MNNMKIKINTDVLKADISTLHKYIENINTDLVALSVALKKIQPANADSVELREKIQNNIKALKSILVQFECFNSYESKAVKNYDICARKIENIVSEIKV